MNCVILAAGLGSRLRACAESKPLTPVGGIPLLEHVVTAAARAGARDFVIVTGHEAERVESFAAGLAARLGLAISCVRTGDWTRANGHSVLTGASAAAAPYLLLMSDHLFHPAIPARLLAQADPEGVALAVDRDLSSPLLDLDDATRVAVDPAGRISRIGKALDRFDAIDTGIFLAGPSLAGAIRDDIAAGGDGSLSAGVQRLADQGLAQAVDVTGARWIDVDDPRMLALAEGFVAGSPPA